MPSGKETFLTLSDERALSDVLREKFPGIRFFDRYGEMAGKWNEIESIDLTDEREVIGLIVSPRWKPRYEQWDFAGDSRYRVANFPEEVIRHLRSSSVAFNRGAGIPSGDRFDYGVLQVGVTPTLTRAQISFANKVWRLISKIGSYRFRLHYWVDDKPRSREWDTKQFFAGNDAIRWALEDENRCFEFAGSGYLRPLV